MNTKYRIGDIFSVPKPGCYKFRIREIIQEPHWDGPQYVLQLYTVYDYKANPNARKWMDRTHDHYYTDQQIEYFGLIIETRGDFVQMEMFA